MVIPEVQAPVVTKSCKKQLRTDHKQIIDTSQEMRLQQELESYVCANDLELRSRLTESGICITDRRLWEMNANTMCSSYLQWWQRYRHYWRISLHCCRPPSLIKGKMQITHISVTATCLCIGVISNKLLHPCACCTEKFNCTYLCCFVLINILIKYTW